MQIFKNEPGIYQISIKCYLGENKQTKEKVYNTYKYIGQTKELDKRIASHISKLNSNKEYRCMSRIQWAYQQRPNDLKIEVLQNINFLNSIAKKEQVDLSVVLNVAESYFISTLGCHNNLKNSNFKHLYINQHLLKYFGNDYIPQATCINASLNVQSKFLVPSKEQLDLSTDCFNNSVFSVQLPHSQEIHYVYLDKELGAFIGNKEVYIREEKGRIAQGIRLLINGDAILGKACGCSPNKPIPSSVALSRAYLALVHNYYMINKEDDTPSGADLFHNELNNYTWFNVNKSYLLGHFKK